MTLEELVYKRLINDDQLKDILASYAGNAAIFYQMAPDDMQSGWSGKSQYPRIGYAIDMQANQERKSAGAMNVSLFCTDSGTTPEEIEPIIRSCLKDIFLSPDNSSPYCFAWAKTEPFEILEREEKIKAKVIGMDIRFDILEFPSQETTDPDPILAMNKFIKETSQDCTVIGYDPVKEILQAGIQEPVFYCRLEDIEKDIETNTVAWMNCRMAVHVFCPSSEVRLKMLMSIANKLSLDGEVIMLDNSPMTIKRLQVNNKADYLADGQLYVTAHYGLLRYKCSQPVLNQINIELK